MPANIETDPLFVLLTDALRAGPESPAWQQAIGALRERGAEGSDEYRLLIDARETLESGREYRAVQAGAGFTRKLINEIDRQQTSPRKGPGTATLIAIFSGILMFAGLGYLIYRLAPHEPTTQEAVDQLAAKATRPADALVAATFAGSIPAGWTTIGALPLDASNGLTPAIAHDRKNVGGGIEWKDALAGTQAFAMDVTVHLAEPSNAVLLEAFVTTDPNFSSDKGTSSNDLVWQLRQRDQQVLLSGSGQHLVGTPPVADGDTIRLLVDKSVAIVEIVSAADSKVHRLWAGAHELGTGPRYAGVRFLQTGAAGKQNLSVGQIKLTLTPG